VDAFRTEHDSFGDIEVPAQRLWGAQTQRSLQHFNISTEVMPIEVVMALVQVKKACAQANAELGELEPRTADAIQQAADEILGGAHREEFPLSLWQTGSGTQTNMNVNEVLANRASELLSGERGSKRLVHANDAVNHGQSSNDVFPTAMHLAITNGVQLGLLPALRALCTNLREKAAAWDDIIKIGRTHLQDATPVTLGQEFSGYAAQLDCCERSITSCLPGLYQLAIGGTAVGTGLNTHPRFPARVAELLALASGLPYRCADNTFAALAGHDAIVAMHGACNLLATALMKLANDIRWLASGPRSGLGELILPANEPGSSMMPGKVNPTQCEALAMVCCQVFGNNVTISVAGASGHFELNTFKPVIAHCCLQSMRVLRDAMHSFVDHCLSGMRPDRQRIADLVERSLMLVTALVPQVGYDRAAEIVTLAEKNAWTLRQANAALGYVPADRFDALINPAAMAKPHS
jgi:fumarate hydratase class II